MIKLLLVLAGLAVFSWWVTRPSSGEKTQRKNIKMEKCPHCGVYVEAGTACRCQENQEK